MISSAAVEANYKACFKIEEGLLECLGLFGQLYVTGNELSNIK